MNEQELQEKIKNLEQKIGEINYRFESDTQTLWIECKETRNIFHSYLFANMLCVDLHETGDDLLEKKQGEELIHFYEDLGNYYEKIIVIGFHAAYALMRESCHFISLMKEKGYIKSDKPNRTLGLSGTEFIKKTEKDRLTQYEDYVKAYYDFFENEHIPLFKVIIKERIYHSFYYFNVQLKCILTEINNQIILFMLNKKNKEIHHLHVNQPNELAGVIKKYFEDLRCKNRVKHVLQEEKYFLTDFLQMLNIDDSTIKNKFYSLLQSSYNSIEIEELAFLYLKEREKIKKRPISGGFFLFKFGDKWYVINQEKLNIHEIKEEELESFLLREYQEKLKKELTVFLSKKESN